jgi:PAS domain S-box-containing protein
VALKRLLTVITRAIGAQYGPPSRIDTFTAFLHDVVELSGSRYGYISETISDGEESSQRTITSVHTSGGTPSTENSPQLRHLQQLGEQALTEQRWQGGDNQSGDSTAAQLLLPVHHGGKLVGVLALGGCEDGYSEDSRTHLEPVAAAAGSLIASRQNQIANTDISAELRRVDARYLQIVQRLPDIITILDGDGQWLYSSPSGTRLLGYPAGYDPSGGVFSLMHEDDAAMALVAFQEVIAGTRTITQPIDLRLRDIHGEYRIFETTGDSLLDDPYINGVLFTSKDVTAHRNTTKDLLAKTSQLDALIESIDDGIVLISDGLQIRHANSAFFRMFNSGREPDEAILANISSGIEPFLSHFVDPQGLYTSTLNLLTSRGNIHDERFELLDGRTVSRDYISILSAGGEWSLLNIWRDITQQVELDRRTARVLKHERAVRSAIEQQNKNLIEFNATKDQFVADVSHELRTPLTSIIGYIELLLLDGDHFNATHLEYIEMLHQNGKNLLALVGNLLLVTRLDAGRVELACRDEALSLLVGSTVDAFKPEAGAKNLTLTVELSTHDQSVSVDSGKFDQVLRNLISNALKFTPDGGTVAVSTHREALAWVISVSDTGIGITDTDLDKVFERFHTGAPVRDDEVSGSGLGLTITKALVELHGGTIDVVSDIGGSTFTITLPDLGRS